MIGLTGVLLTMAAMEFNLFDTFLWNDDQEAHGYVDATFDDDF